MFHRPCALIGCAAVLVAACSAEDAAVGATSSAAPTFTRDVAPIVFQSCAPCHRPGAAAPFPLLSYRDVQKRAKQIALVTENRFMPPWLPAPGSHGFLGDRRLAQADIETLRRWWEAGALEGDPSDLPPEPEWTSGWQLGQPDLVLEPSVPFVLAADGGEEFRNLVIPVPVQTTRYVRAMEMRPGPGNAVHHAILQIDRTPFCRRLDAEDDAPGFPGMSMGASQPPDGHFLGWTPGKLPAEVPADMAWRLYPGSDLVLQLHMTRTGRQELVQPKIGLYFTETPPSRFPYSIVLFSESIDIPPGAKDHKVIDEYVLPVDVEVFGLYPHAHYLGTMMRGVARLPGGKSIRSKYR